MPAGLKATANRDPEHAQVRTQVDRSAPLIAPNEGSDAAHRDTALSDIERALVTALRSLSDVDPAHTHHGLGIILGRALIRSALNRCNDLKSNLTKSAQCPIDESISSTSAVAPFEFEAYFTPAGVNHDLNSSHEIIKHLAIVVGVPDHAHDEFIRAVEAAAAAARIDASASPPKQAFSTAAATVQKRKTPLALPDKAPELYANRADRSETPVKFLKRVWGRYMKAGVLYQDDLRRMDARLLPAIQSYCRNRNIRPQTMMPPPMKVRTDRILSSAPEDSAEHKLARIRVQKRTSATRSRARLAT